MPEHRGLLDYFALFGQVPGWLEPLDFRMIVAINEYQDPHPHTAGILEIGSYYGKTAILFGFLLRAREELYVCDLFEEQDELSARERQWYQGLSQREFMASFSRFHTLEPVVLKFDSGELLQALGGHQFRIVHVDGGHDFETAARDLTTAAALLSHESGIVILDDYARSHLPGVAAALWDAVGRGVLYLVALSDAKAYLAKTKAVAAQIRGPLRAWADTQPDLLVEALGIRGDDVLKLHVRSQWFAPDQAR